MGNEFMDSGCYRPRAWICKYQLHQDMLSNNDTMMQDMKPNVTGMQQPARPSGAVNVSILNNLSQARLMNNGALMRILSIVGNLVAMHMSNMISNEMDSTVPVSQTMISCGQPGITPISRTVQSTVPVPGLFTSNMSGSLNQPLGNHQVEWVTLFQDLDVFLLVLY